MTELAYERDAMANRPMPDGLDYVDAVMYQGLAYLYQRYHVGAVDREQATAEKRKMLRWYSVQKNAKQYEDMMYRLHADLMKAAEGAANAYAKARTLENADRLYQVIYGILPKGEKE